MEQVDVVVLGGGPGGYPAAFEAAIQGMNVALVTEEEKPGGVCLHRGCIPSKALLHVAKLIHEAHESAEWGVTFGEPKIDLDKLRAFRSSVVDQLVGGVAGLCKSRGVKLYHARGTFLDSNTLQLRRPDGYTARLQFKTCIVATGSLPAMPPIFNIGDDRVMDSTGALELPDIPERLLVIGGGYIGLEMGTVYAALGTKVTVVEMTSGLLPGADRDLVRPLAKRLGEQFDAIHLNTKVAGLRATDEGIVAKLESDSLNEEQTFDRVLVSVGRRPNSRNLGLENTKAVVTDRGFIEVNAKLQTADPSLLAVGDVAGEPMLAHKATKEGRVAVEALAGEPAEFDNIAIPAVVFTDPELAWCGLTEAEAKEQGRKVQVFRFPWAASGRAQTLKRTEGLTKLICEEGTERILGMGIVGAGAGELIAEGVLAVENALVARDVAGSIHAHPTLSETVMEAAEGIFSEPTHMHRPPRKKR
ncbi:MAG: dihydrolipoyl dehydrogenase [Planctomycetaceae bacterium]|nr:dihydrolipoyl dehydrogenase [Planctomycetaceae bacterium]